MLVLLPPSEGKAAGGSGAPLDLGSLSLPGLAGARAAVLDELVELCAADETKAREVLGLSEGLRGEVAKNAELRSAVARPAGEIYTGVLYDALGLVSLPEAGAGPGRAVAAGVLRAVGRGADDGPDPHLPVLDGREAARARRAGRVLADADGGGHATGGGGGPRAGPALLRVRVGLEAEGEVAGRTATVRVLHSQVVDGVEKRSVVSHFNKATKGLLVRDLLLAGAVPGSPAELVEALRELGYAVEAQEPGKPAKPWSLDVVVTQIH